MTREVLAEPELREYVQEHVSMLTERMTARFTKDKDAGVLPAEFDPQFVTLVIVTYLQGLVSYDQSRFERQNDLFLTGFRSTPCSTLLRSGLDKKLPR